MSKSAIFLKIAAGMSLLTIGVVAVVEEAASMRRRTEATAESRARLEKEIREDILFRTLDSDIKIVWEDKIKAAQREKEDSNVAWQKAMKANKFDEAKAADLRFHAAEDLLDDFDRQIRIWKDNRK